MTIAVRGKGMDVGEALRFHVETKLEDISAKYFGRITDASAAFAREAHMIRCDVQLHVGRGISANAHGESDQAHGAFDRAAERLAKQLRRHKRRLRDHHPAMSGTAEALPAATTAARYAIVRLEEGEEDGAADDAAHDDALHEDAAHDDAAVPVIAESDAPLLTLTVADAVLRLDLEDRPVLMFRSLAHGGLNVVYRRQDGLIGWIDPADKAEARGLPAR